MNFNVYATKQSIWHDGWSYVWTNQVCSTPQQQIHQKIFSSLENIVPETQETYSSARNEGIDESV